MKLTTTTNQVSSSKYSLEEMDRLYHILRAEIVKGFENYLTSDFALPLFNVDSKRISITGLSVACVDERHYNCNTCREFFYEASGYCYMDSEGNLVSPILDAFNKVPELAVFVQDQLTSLNQKLNQGRAKPVYYLPSAVGNEVKGFDQDNETEWTHFYLANKSLIESYNTVGWSDASGQVKSFVKVFSEFSKNNHDFNSLKAIANTVEAMLNLPTTTALFHKLIELYDLFNKTKNKSTFLLGYLSSPKNDAVRRWNSSTANFIVDAIVNDRVDSDDIKKLAEIINHVTRGEVYKHQTKEVTVQHLENVIEQLESCGCGDILLRKAANPSDLPWFVTLDPIETPEKKTEEPANSLRRAALVLQDKKQNKSSESLPEIQKKISQEGLIKYLVENKDKIESLHLRKDDLVIPTFFTKPIGNVDYSEFLKVDESGILLSFLTQPVRISGVCSSQSWDVVEKKLTEKGIPIDGFGVHNDALYLSTPIVEIFKDTAEGFGTLIIGSHIKNEKYELANVLAKMSVETPLDFSEATHSYFQSFFYSDQAGHPGTKLVVKEKGVGLYTVYSVVTKN